MNNATPSLNQSLRSPSARPLGISGLAAALALTMLPVAQAHAGLITATQQVTVSGTSFSENFVETPISDSFTGSAIFDSEHDFASSISGIDNGKVEWFADGGDSSGTIKTTSKLGVGHVFGAGGDDFSDLKIDASQTIKFSDTVTSSDTRGRSFEFQTVLTGELTSTVNYGDPSVSGASKATYESNIEFSANIASNWGNPDSVVGFGQTSSVLGTPGPFNENVDETDLMESVIISFEQQPFLGSNVLFSWELIDSFLVDIESIDAGSIDLVMNNDLGNTITIYASVYDADGALLPDARVQSSQGFAYMPIPGAVVPTPAPIPSSALLVLLGCLGFAGRHRRA